MEERWGRGNGGKGCEEVRGGWTERRDAADVIVRKERFGKGEVRM